MSHLEIVDDDARDPQAPVPAGSKELLDAIRRVRQQVPPDAIFTFDRDEANERGMPQSDAGNLK